jgi:putative restriction endonuclease
VRPDYVIEVQKRVLDEHDGPMLLHGLKELHRTKIVLPRDVHMRPDPTRLEQRYREFTGVG